MIKINKTAKIKNFKNFQRIKKQKSIGKKVIFYFVLFIFLAVSFWVFIFSNLAEIKDCSIKTECQNLSQEEASQKIKEYLNEKYFYFFPKKNIILFNSRDINGYFKNDNKLIKAAEVKKFFPKKVEIKIFCEKEYFIWRNQGNYFMINSEGKIFSEILEEEKNRYGENKIFLESENPGDFKSGDEVFSQEEAKFFLDISGELENLLAMAFKKDLKLPILAAKELTVQSEKGWVIIFDIAQPMEKQIKIIVALFNGDFKNRNLDDLEYVDLRIKGKAIYKFKETKSEKNDNEENTEQTDEDNNLNDDKNQEKNSEA